MNRLERNPFRLKVLVSVTVVAAAPFLVTLNAPLLHDSYAHVAVAANQSFPEALAFFVHPSGNDLFFRPLGYFSYWFDFHWAGDDPLRWHLWNLLFHVANCYLLYLLATELSLSRLPDRVAGLIYLDAAYPYALYDPKSGGVDICGSGAPRAADFDEFAYSGRTA